MPTIFEGRSSYNDLIDDIVESPSSSYPIKTIQNRNYSSVPSSLHKTDNPPIIRTNEHRDRLHLPLPRSNSSLIMMSNDERRKEIDLIIKHLYDGKLITPINDDYPPLDDTEPSIHMLSKEPLTTTTMKTNKENHVDVRILITLKESISIRVRCRATRASSSTNMPGEIQGQGFSLLAATHPSKFGPLGRARMRELH